MLNLLFFVFLRMTRFGKILLILLVGSAAWSQEVRLPVDLRQHNLTEYNSSIFNPALSLARNNPQSISLWSRWQWQQIDADPTTFFLNYTRKLNRNSAVGAAFFQHNTGVFNNTGGVLNYAYVYQFSPTISLGMGLNLFGFKQQLSDDRFFSNLPGPLPLFRITDDFILQAAPGLFLMWDRLGIGLASENLFDYNFTTKERQSTSQERIYSMSGSYDFQLGADAASVFRPALYWKSIPDQDNQIGLSALYSTDKYWGQAGYNSFYGISVGAGGRFIQKLSLGALIEFGTDSALEGKSSTFEIMLAYHIGPQFEEEMPEEPLEQKEELIVEAEKLTEKEAEAVEKLEKDRIKQAEEAKAKAQKEEALATAENLKQQRKDSLDRVKKDKALAEAAQKNENKKREALAMTKKQEALAETERLNAQKRRDSINKAEETLALAQQMEQQRKLDSISNAQVVAAALEKEKAEQAKLARQPEKVKTQANEKYEEVATEEGLQPGFYLIANVFGTQKYYEAFMKNMTDKGLGPQSFRRKLNNYNYVYLGRYDTMEEARKARDGKLNGRYPDKTWIFRVVGQ
jgi:type IX secretion system PorP/SprF family membrane protein